MNKFFSFLIVINVMGMPQGTNAQQSYLKYEPVNFSQVNITDNFWKPKLDKVAIAMAYSLKNRRQSFRSHSRPVDRRHSSRTNV